MKKYDCFKSLDLIHEYDRICVSHGCYECPLKHFDDCESLSKYDTEMIAIIQAWSDAHPEMNRIDKFRELLRGTEFEDLAIACFSIYPDNFDNITVLQDGHVQNKDWWFEICEDE